MAFRTITPLLTAKKLDEVPDALRWVKLHQDGLNAQAAGLDNLSQALMQRRTLNAVTVRAILDAADTAAARVRGMEIMEGHLTALKLESQEDVRLFLESHRKALMCQAVLLGDIAATLRKAQAKADALAAKEW